MKRLKVVLDALWAGQKLRNSATWKNRAAFIAAVAPLLTLVSQFAASRGWLPGELTAEEIEAIGEWVWMGSGIVLAYWFRATSASVGFEPLEYDQAELGYVPQHLAEEGREDLSAGGVLSRPGRVLPVRRSGQGDPDYFPGDDSRIVDIARTGRG